MSTQWYAVQSKARQETAAKLQLEHQGYTVFLAMISVRKRRRGAWTEVLEPLFPRYLFVQVNANEQSLAPIRSTVGVSGLVRFGSILRAVPDSVVHFLQQAEVGRGTLSGEESWPFQPGDQVEVLQGAFAGLSAVFKEGQPEARAMILIELLGRQNSVEVPIDTLSAIESD